MILFRKSAFTLIELLVSLALSGVLILILNNLISNSFFVDSKIRNQLEYRLQIEHLLLQIEADIHSASNKPNGSKSIKLVPTQDGVILYLKRFGISPATEQIIGFDAVWTIDTLGVSRLVRTSRGTFTRIISTTFIAAEVEKFPNSVVRLKLTNDAFSKSKMFKL